MNEQSDGLRDNGAINWRLVLVAAWFVSAVGLAFAGHYSLLPLPSQSWALGFKPGLLALLVYLIGRTQPRLPGQ